MSVPDSSRSRGGYESREVVGFWGSGPGPPRGEPSAGTAVRSGCSRGSSRRPVRVIIPTNPSTSALFRVGFRLGGHARRGDRGRSSAASSGRILARAINGQRQAARKNPSAGLGGVRVRVPPPTRRVAIQALRVRIPELVTGQRNCGRETGRGKDGPCVDEPRGGHLSVERSVEWLTRCPLDPVPYPSAWLWQCRRSTIVRGRRRGLRRRARRGP